MICGESALFRAVLSVVLLGVHCLVACEILSLWSARVISYWLCVTLQGVLCVIQCEILSHVCVLVGCVVRGAW